MEELSEGNPHSRSSEGDSVWAEKNSRFKTENTDPECMGIIRGALDDISRPASTSSHSDLRRKSSDKHRSLEMLSPDLSHTQVQEQTHEEMIDSAPENSSDQEECHEEKGEKDKQLVKAMKKMRRLDQVLELKEMAEREVKKKSQELHQRVRVELQVHASTERERGRERERDN
ncbi:hypothetical protein DNTS_016273 [Danionella cerebrum]|uniref:Fibrous sheath-interacting protein 1 n=1 Tax=Danionella cerebrum TaxID=2873325 RepID=A0A553Q0V7_9TELE|nr:hypothetical protein DNTS_016273 [Danionella translucida]